VLFSEPSDTELIDEVLNGDTDSFSGLVTRHQQKVIGFCLSMLSNRQAAEDATQEIFVKAFTAISGFRRDSSFSTWLYRIAFNHCCSLRKKSSKIHMESLDAMPNQDRVKTMVSNAKYQSEADGGSALASEKAMAALPEGYRAVMVMRLQGVDYRTIALSLGISEDSVRAKLRRARVILRARLRHFFPDLMSKISEKP